MNSPSCEFSECVQIAQKLNLHVQIAGKFQGGGTETRLRGQAIPLGHASRSRRKHALHETDRSQRLPRHLTGTYLVV